MKKLGFFNSQTEALKPCVTDGDWRDDGVDKHWGPQDRLNIRILDSGCLRLTTTGMLETMVCGILFSICHLPSTIYYMPYTL